MSEDASQTTESDEPSDERLASGPEALLAVLVGDPDPDDRTAWRWVSRGYVIGVCCHLLLWDAWQWSWMPGNVLMLAGAALLCWRGSILGWTLSFFGVGWPLLFGHDQLTQSMIMLVWCGAAVAGLLADSVGSDGADADASPESPGSGLLGAIRAIQGVTALTYAIAVIHKLNADFFNPSYSCAVYGVREVVAYWQLGIELPGWVGAASPFVIVGVEGSIAALLLLRRHRAAWCLAVPFHLALTFTMAPAFGFVMAAGHLAYATAADRRRMVQWSRDYWSVILAGASGACVTSAVVHGEPSSVTMTIREAMAWGAWIIVWGAVGPWTERFWRPSEGPRGGRATKVVYGAAILIFAFNGVTPYLGLQYQHTGAMVSNMRIDRGCWNSLVFPESLRLRDPYIRVDEAYMGEPGRVPYYEEIVTSQLWHPPEIRQMRRNWCDPSIRPFYLSGTYLDERFEIEDLCADAALPFGELRIGGWAVFGRSVRFQENLQRTCPQPCIH